MTCPFGSILRGMTGSVGFGSADASGFARGGALGGSGDGCLVGDLLHGGASLRFFFTAACVFVRGLTVLPLAACDSGGFQTSV